MNTDKTPSVINKIVCSKNLKNFSKKVLTNPTMSAIISKSANEVERNMRV